MRGARVCSLINIFHTSFFFLIQNLDGNDGKYEAHKCFYSPSFLPILCDKWLVRIKISTIYLLIYRMIVLVYTLFVSHTSTRRM